MNSLVGYTGFVGSNLYAKGQFDCVYNSKNIEDAYGTRPKLLVFAGLRAEKYIANNDPKRDMALIYEAEDNILKIAPKKLVLISTIDVFKSPLGVDENSFIDTDGLNAYGYDRYKMELWVRENYPDALIIRLPALFGMNIKKNFIYDYMNVIPSMLKGDKFDELVKREAMLKEYYLPLDNGFYRLDAPNDKKDELKRVFSQLGFCALSFTDSRSRYQFYNLERLWNDMQKVLKEGIRLWHPATEPMSAGELYEFLSGEEFINELDGAPANYDYRTIYGEMFGGRGGYICKKESVMEEIRDLVLC